MTDLLDTAVRSVLADIIATAPLPPENPNESSGMNQTPRRFPAMVTIAAALIVVLGLTGVVLIAQRDQSTAPASSTVTTPVAVAPGAPRLLLSPEWQIEGFGNYSSDVGEMTFANGDQSLDLFWTPIDQYAGLLADRSASAVGGGEFPETPDTTFFDYGDGEIRAVWMLGDHTIEVVTQATSTAALNDILTDIHEVDADTWLQALPASIVQPDDQASVVADMIADIPLPPGFNRNALPSGDTIGNRAQLSVAVLTPIVCDWINAWFDAEDASDTDAARDAEQTLANARQWTLVQEMSGESWTTVMLELTDAVANGSPVTAGNGPEPISRDSLAGIGCVP